MKSGPTSMSASGLIASRDNATFKALRALAEDAREPRKQGRAFADGIHLVQTALNRGACVQQLVISESAQGHPEVVALQMHYPMLDALVLRDSLYREISPLSASVGLSAIVGIPAPRAVSLEEGGVVLDAVQDAGNVGAILRTVAAAGVATVVLGSGCAGAWTSRVLRAGQGAHFNLVIHEQIDLTELLKSTMTDSINTVATVAKNAESIYAVDLTGPVVWLFGNEGAGLAPGLAAIAKMRATIPLDVATESLNVGAAAAICLFEAVRQRRAGTLQLGRTSVREGS